jgi:hypothetical protein
MDEAKRKELEELRKKIDPEVLKRVAESMGGSEAGAVAGATSGGGGGGDTSAPAKPRSRPAGGGAGGGLADLKKRIQRRERELDKQEEEKPETKPVVFVVYAPSHFRAKQLGGYLNRVGFNHVVLCSEPQEFIKNLINTLNDGNVERVAIAVHRDIYPGLTALLRTPEMQQVMSKLPKLAEAPTFAVIEENEEQAPPEGLDPSYAVSLRTSPEFNRKRMLKVLGIEES